MLNWLKPKPIILSNGKIITPKMSPAVYIVPILLIITYFSIGLTRFRLDMLFNRGYQFFVIVSQIYLLIFQKQINFHQKSQSLPNNEE